MTKLANQLISLKGVDVTVLQSDSEYRLTFSSGGGASCHLVLPHITINEVPLEQQEVRPVVTHHQPKPRRNARKLRRARACTPILQEWQVQEIKQMLNDTDFRKEYPSNFALHKAIGAIYGVTGANINAIDKGYTWKSVKV